MTFQNPPLPSDNHIRLVTIFPDQSGPIRANLNVEDESNCPHYKCLSYTWDGPRIDDTEESWRQPSFIINVNRFEVFVQPNLHNALLHLRDLGILGPLWIDALCINQTDNTEKKIQVARMNQIFGNAAEVLAWLGTGDARAVSVIRDIEKFGVIHEDLMKQEVASKILNPLEEDTIDDDKLIRMFDFSLEFNWFRRIWVVQEMLLARRLRFFCGTTTMGLESVWAMEILLFTARAFFGAKQRGYLFGYLRGLSKGLSGSYSSARYQPNVGTIKIDVSTVSASTPNIFEGMEEENGVRFLRHIFACKDRIDHHYDVAGQKSLSSFGGLSALLESGFPPTVRVDGRDKYPLSLLAHELRVKKAKRPQDKLYGILGISATSSNLLSVNYSIPVDRIFIEAAVLGLSEFPFLSSLSFVGPKELNRFALPSWVPDYTTALKIKPLAPIGCRFRTGLAWESKAQPSPDSTNLLFLEGACFDTVSRACAAHWLHTDVHALPTMLNMILNPVAACSPSDLSLLDLLCQTLHAEFIREEKLSEEIDNNKISFQQWLFHRTYLALAACNDELADAFLKNPSSTFEDAMHSLGISGGTEPMLSSFANFEGSVWRNLSMILEKEPSMQDFDFYWSLYKEDAFQKAWTDVCTGRSLFRTDKGFLGLGPRETRPGDLVFILKGAAVPYLFRKCKVEDKFLFELHGDVYMHGIMYGEIDTSSLVWDEIVVH